MEQDQPEPDDAISDPPAISRAVREALDHPVRRQILETLLADGRPQSASDLAAAVTAAGPTATVANVRYHAEVLRKSGALTLAGARQLPGNLAPLYTARVSG